MAWELLEIDFKKKNNLQNFLGELISSKLKPSQS